jgi:hypothetical protein
MDKVNQILENLKTLGFDQEKIDGTMKLLYEDLQDEMFADFTDKASDEEVTEYEERMKNAKSVEHMGTIIKELAAKVYGDQSETTLQQKLVEKLQQVEEMTKKMKENFDKYQAGDPATVQAVNEAANTEDAQDIADVLLKGE